MTLNITGTAAIVFAAVALFYVGRDIFWLFRPHSSPGARGLATGWDEGFDQGWRDSENEQEPADNPYREVRR